MIRSHNATGAHNQRMAHMSKRVTKDQMLQKIKSKQENPLFKLVEKFKKQVANFQTDKIYPDELIGQKVQQIDKLLSHNGKLGPLLASLQSENNILRNELSIMSYELNKTLAICEQLISENKQQKQIIINKNEDIRKIIETIAINQSESKGELEYQNHLLQQQNSILIKHMEEIKKQKQKWNVSLNDLEDQIKMWKEKWTENNNNLMNALEREQQIARKLSLLEQNHFMVTQKFDTTKKQNQDLLIEVNSMKNQLLRIKQGDGKQKNDFEKLKQNYEQQIINIIQDYEQLKQERQGLIRQAQKFKIENEKLHTKNNDLQREIQKLVSNFELTTSLLTQQKSKNANITNNISRLQAKIVELKSQNQNYKFQVQRIGNILNQKERLLQKQIDQMRRQLEQRTINEQKRISDLKKRETQKLEAKEQQIEQLILSNQQLKKKLQRYEKR